MFNKLEAYAKIRPTNLRLKLETVVKSYHN